LRFALVAPMVFGYGAFGQFADQAAGSVGAAYRVDPGFFRMPEGRPFGSTAGIVADPDGRSIWVFDRCGAGTCVGSDHAPVLRFDADGEVTQSFGAGMFVRPHGIFVDDERNVWVTDGEGLDGMGHQVFKFSSDGQLLMSLGEPGIAGEDDSHFNQPSDVLVAPGGDIFVADGHGRDSNARIVKFSKDGEFLLAWGGRGTAPGKFNTPHALAMDSRGRLFVGDRGNYRIQIFDQDGNFQEEWKQFGNPSGLYIDRQDVIYVSEIGSNPEQGADWREGIRIGNALTGEVTAFIPDAERSTQEGVTADAAGNVFGAYTVGMQLKRYVRVSPD
jgi:DNA-binding beta-propeller fold protein YncE